MSETANREDESGFTADINVSVAGNNSGMVAGAYVERADTVNLVVPPRPAAAQVPPAARYNFFGRVKQQQDVATALKAYRTVLIHGTVGMGKTALAAAVAVQLDRDRIYKHGIVWIGDIFLASLPAVCDKVAWQLDDRQVPRLPPEAKPGALRSILATRAEMLLVLDAFADTRTARRFLEQCLPEQIAVLATSRTVHGLFDVETAVRPLCVPEAVQLFEDRATVKTKGDALVGDICVAVGCHPQAIVLAAGRHRAEGIALMSLLTRLNDQKKRLPALDGTDSGEEGLEASLRLSVAALKDGPREAFLWLSACFGDWTTVPLLAAARGVSADTCEDDVGQLAKASLIERGDNGQLLMERLVRDFGREQPQPDLALRRRGILAAALHYAVDEAAAASDQYAHFEAELSNLLGAVRFAAAIGEWATVMTLARTLAHPVSGVLSVRGHWAEMVTLLDVGSKAAEQNHDDTSRAWYYAAAAVARSKRGEQEKARSLYAQSARLLRMLGSRTELAKVVHNIGKLQQDQGRYKAARRAYQRSLRLKEGGSDRLGTARTLHELGRLAIHEGHYADAREALAESLAIKGEMVEPDVLGMALTRFAIARLDHMQGDYPRAHTGYDESEALYKGKVDDNAGLALVGHYRGRLAYDEGHLDVADKLYAASFSTFKELGSTQELADVISDRAVLAIERSDFTRADADLQDCLVLKERIGDAPGHASSRLEQVRSLRLQRKLDSARAILDTVTKIVAKLGEQSAIVRSQFEAGCLERAVGNTDLALNWFVTSLNLAVSLGLRLEQAENHEQLGQLAAERGDPPTARDHLASSLALFETLNQARAAVVRTLRANLEER